MKSKNTYYWVVFVLSYTSILGQTPADTLTWSIYLEDVVVTAQYAPTDSRHAIQDIRVIKRELIDRRGANNLEQLLQQEPNIRIQQDLILGSSLSLGGISGQNVKILLDGVPIIGRQGGNIDLSQINLQNIERIEIVQGPLGVSYGTDALGGVIHLISKKSQLKPLSIGLNTQRESRGENSLGGYLGWRWKDKLLWQFKAGQDRFSGYSEDTTRSVLWNPKKQWFTTASLGIQLAEEQNLRYTFNYFDEQVDKLGDVRRPQFKPYAFDDRYQTLRQDHALSFEGDITKHHYLKAVAAFNAYTRYKNTFRNNLEEETLEEELGQQDSSFFDSYMIRATLASRYADHPLNFQLGMDLRYDQARGKRIKDLESGRLNYSELGDYAVFGTLRYQLAANLTVETGLRYAYNTKYKSPLIPSLNLKYSWNPHWILRGAYGRGFRSPDLKELFFEFVDVNHYIIGNPNLKAEQSDNVQFNLQYLAGKNQNDWSAKLSGFYNHIRDKIELFEFIESSAGISPAIDTSTLQFAYFNQAIHKTQGVQLQLNGEYQAFHWQVGSAMIAYYNPLSNSVPNVNTYSYAYEWNTECRYQWEKPQLSASLFLRYNDRRITFYPEIDDEGNSVARQRSQQGFWMLDSSIQFSKLWKGRVQLTTGARNILNVQAVGQSSGGGGAHSGSANSSPISPGRSFFVRLNFDFSH